MTFILIMLKKNSPQFSLSTCKKDKKKDKIALKYHKKKQKSC